MNTWPSRLIPQRGVLFILTTVIAFLVYLRTLAPTVLSGDSGEFQFAAWGWTLAHPTGYPLYLLLGGLWQHLLPFGDPAYRLNLFSAVWSALAVGLAYQIFLRVTERRSTALIATFMLAFSPTFWSQATKAEVYALNSFFIALLIYLALKWQEQHTFKYSAAWTLTLGLALTHHRSIILLIPAFAAFFAPAIITRIRNFKSLRTPLLKHATMYTLLLALPLLLYAYIPIRASATPYTQLRVSSTQTIVTFDNTPRGWLNYILGNTFQSKLAFNAESIDTLQELPKRLMKEFNPVGVAVGLFGFLALFYRRQFSLAALTFFGFCAIVLFNAMYHISDITDFYTPAFLVFAICLACGINAIVQLLILLTRQFASSLPFIALLAFTAALPMQNFFSEFVVQDRSLHTEWNTRAHTILKSELPTNAILISNDRDEITPLWYVQTLEGLRPDVLALFPLISPDPAYANITRIVDSTIDLGRPLFLTKQMSGLALRYRLISTSNDLYRVAQAWLPTPTFESNARVGDKVRVLGYSIVSGTVRPQNILRLAVYWQIITPLDRNYSTSLQILDEAGDKIAQGDDHQPGEDIYPTSMWQPGETLRDEFVVTLPETVAGTLHLAVKMYDEESEDLQTLGELTEIGTLSVE